MYRNVGTKSKEKFLAAVTWLRKRKSEPALMVLFNDMNDAE